MSFTAKDVQALREKTGVGMMDCKKALVESDGDMDKAIDFLREKGLAAATKKAGRIAAEGIVLAYTDEAKNVSVLIEVNSETDFVAKNEEFKFFVLNTAKTVVEVNPVDVEALLASKLSGSDRTVQENLQDKILSIGENMKVRRFERVEGTTASYIHGGGTVGVMVMIDTNATDSASVQEMGKNVAMQIAAMFPSYLDEASVPADVLEHEKVIMKAQLAEDPKMVGKPDMVLSKIVEGKISKFFKENCLMEQEYVKSENSESIAQYVESVAKSLGSEIKITGFFRYAKGEGIQKKEEDFAAEVASMMG